MVAATVACLAVGVAVVPWSWKARFLIDRSAPLLQDAASFHVMILLATAAVGWWALALAPSRNRGRLLRNASFMAIPAGLVALGVGVYFPGQETGILVPLFLFVLLASIGSILTLIFALLIAPIVLFIYAVSKPPRSAEESLVRKVKWLSRSFTGAWGFALGHALVSLYVLLTLPQRAEAAEAARQAREHPIPGMEVILLLSMLLVSAVLLRRHQRNLN